MCTPQADSYRRRPSLTAIYASAVVLCGATMSSLNAQELDLIDKVQIHKPAAGAVTVQQRMPEFLPKRSAKEENIVHALSRKTEVAFRDNDLTSALEHLKDLHEIEIWVDASRLDVDNLKVTLEISDIPLRSCLNLMLEPLDLAYFVEDDTLKVTTQEIAAAKFITRTYPANDLFSSPQEMMELTKVLETGLGLQQKAGIPHPLILSLKSRAIVLRQSHQMHDQLLQLLRTLRDVDSDGDIAKRTPAPHELVLNLGYERDKQGKKVTNVPTVFYDTQLCLIEELPLADERRQIVRERGKNAAQETIILIRADREVPLTTLQQLIERCKATGFTNIVLRSADEE